LDVNNYIRGSPFGKNVGKHCYILSVMDDVINKNVGKHCYILSVMDSVINKNVGKHCYILSVMDSVINKNVGKHCYILSVMDSVINKNVQERLPNPHNVTVKCFSFPDSMFISCDFVIMGYGSNNLFFPVFSFSIT
jgi:uncharacterized UBP type Zn finger protein